MAGLDTIKYTNKDFQVLASQAIDQAITATTPTTASPIDLNQRLMTFILLKEKTVARIDSDGDKAVFDLGHQLGFNLLISFSGLDYTYLGNFTNLRPEAVLWRVQMLHRAIDGRRSSWETRIATGLVTKDQAALLDRIVSQFTIWLVVNGDRDRDNVKTGLAGATAGYNTEVYSVADIDRELNALGDALV